LQDSDFENKPNFTCFADPGTCPDTVNGVSMSFFYKRAIPMQDVYLQYFNSSGQFANNRETMFSSGESL
jgi:hypothetical protein